jgi:hypothetical protein
MAHFVTCRQKATMQKIREGTSRYMSENFGISTATTEVMFDTGLIREDIARKVLIRDEYYQGCDHCGKTELKEKLADKYAVSLSTVEKYLTKGFHQQAK